MAWKANYPSVVAWFLWTSCNTHTHPQLWCINTIWWYSKVTHLPNAHGCNLIVNHVSIYIVHICMCICTYNHHNNVETITTLWWWLSNFHNISLRGTWLTGSVLLDADIATWLLNKELALHKKRSVKGALSFRDGMGQKVSPKMVRPKPQWLMQYHHAWCTSTTA